MMLLLLLAVVDVVVLRSAITLFAFDLFLTFISILLRIPLQVVAATSPEDSWP